MGDRARILIHDLGVYLERHTADFVGVTDIEHPFIVGGARMAGVIGKIEIGGDGLTDLPFAAELVGAGKADFEAWQRAERNAQTIVKRVALPPRPIQPADKEFCLPGANP